VSGTIKAVKQSIRDALSDDPQPDWRDSLGDAFDIIEAVEAERDELLAALRHLTGVCVRNEDGSLTLGSEDVANLERKVAKAGGAK
jgi:hypothetical protein